jgi:GH15 family glucan-1,4-alpha-glucosidase
MLASDGRRALGEHTLRHLRGWRDSRPVRLGNQAWMQRQLDVLGEVLDSGRLLADQVETLDEATRELLVGFAERAAAQWRHDDAGMWEARDRERPYTSSKVMCWVALDRAIDLASRGMLGDELPLDRWRGERQRIREAVLERAWSDRAGAFAGALGSDELDASVLLMPLVGIVEPNDPRWLATLDAIRDRLTSGPLVHRWADDPNGFLLCSYWLVECEALAGRLEDARDRFEALDAFANDVGLMTEMVVPGSGESAGNLPQAFSHVGLINAAWRLTETAPAG